MEKATVFFVSCSHLSSSLLQPHHVAAPRKTIKYMALGIDGWRAPVKHNAKSDNTFPTPTNNFHFSVLSSGILSALGGVPASNGSPPFTEATFTPDAFFRTINTTMEPINMTISGASHCIRDMTLKNIPKLLPNNSQS